MSNVISLAVERRARQVAPINALPYDRLLYTISRVAHRHVSLQASYLLLQIATYINEGTNELSYGLLSEELCLTKKTLIKYVEELESAGFIKVRRSRINHTTNAVNQFEIDFNSAIGVDVPPLKISKKFNESGSVKNTPPPRGVVENLHGKDINTKSNKRISKDIQRNSARQFETVSEALEHVAKRVVRKRAEKVAKVTKPGGTLTLAGVKATWATCMLKHHPTVPPVTFTAKDFAIFKQKVTPLLGSCNLSELFDYFVSSWAFLRSNKFAWLRAQGKDVSLAPSLPEIMRYWKVFAQSFADSRMEVSNNENKATRSEVEDLKDALAAANAAKAVAESEVRKLAERAIKAERMAFGKRTAVDAPVESLTARRKKAEAAYNGDLDIPDWGKNEQR